MGGCTIHVGVYTCDPPAWTLLSLIISLIFARKPTVDPAWYRRMAWHMYPRNVVLRTKAYTS